MSLATEVEQTAVGQSGAILRRAAEGSRTGVYAVTHLGSHLLKPASQFIGSSAKAEEAWLLFVKAAMGFERRRTPVSAAALEKSLARVESLINDAHLSKEDAALLRRELEAHKTALMKQEKAAAEVQQKAAAASRQATPRRAGAAADLVSKTLHAKVQNAFYDAMRKLETPGATLGQEDLRLLRAYRKLSHAVGSEMEGGWKKVFDLLIEETEEGSKWSKQQAVKHWKEEYDRLSALLEKATDPAEIETLKRAFNAERKNWLHSRVKGLLGELFATRWKDWRLIKSGYVDLARRATRKLGSEWEVLSVAGNMHLGGGQTWDEAILLVNRTKTPNEAKLFLGAQFKVKGASDALEQTLNDVAREMRKNDLRIVREGGAEDWFLLTPMEPGQKAYRWVLNAEGGLHPTADLDRLIQEGVTVHHQTLPITLEEFNRLADALLTAATASF